LESASGTATGESGVGSVLEELPLEERGMEWPETATLRATRTLEPCNGADTTVVAASLPLPSVATTCGLSTCVGPDGSAAARSIPAAPSARTIARPIPLSRHAACAFATGTDLDESSIGAMYPSVAGERHAGWRYKKGEREL